MERDPAQVIGERIVEVLRPKKLVLFSRKVSVDGSRVSGLDFCAVTDREDREALTKEVYLKVESEIPFNIYLYTEPEWETLSRETGSFAERIRQRGVVLYDSRTV